MAAENAIDSATAKKLFAHPPREYSSAPLWVWNDLLTDEQIVSTLRDLAQQRVKQVFVHPRPGLMTPYLSPEWFRLWKVAIKEAKKLDMNVWIYDENSYPSGFAGGWVPELMPESRGRGLQLRESKTPPVWTNDVLAVFQVSDNKIADVTSQAKRGDKLPPAQYVTASVVRAPQRPWNGDRYYVDLLYPGVTEKFLEVTLEAYRREIGSEFGKHVPGSFTDEPQIHPAGGLPWTDSLPEDFQKRYGYSLAASLPSLLLPTGDWKKVRYDYFRLLNELFIARWAKPYFEYCAQNHLEFTGHYWEHSWPNCTSVPDNMAMYAWHQRPSIDILMNQYRENDAHAQFGNVRSVKELGSVANQLGRRTLCEAYGAGGWDLRFEDMKRIGDWLYVLGVNTMDQHLSYITIRGARKRDHPQSFSYHEPWWNDYHISGAYFERLSAALAQGKQANPVLLLEPTTTAWMYNSGGKEMPELTALGASFQRLLQTLEAAQVEYDLGDEDILERHGSVREASLVIGQAAYRTVVVPPETENLNQRTVELLTQFLQAGGEVLWAPAQGPRINGALSDRAQHLLDHTRCKKVAPESLASLMAKLTGPDQFSITRKPADAGTLFHHRRRLADGQLLFLVNTSSNAPTAGEFQIHAQGIEQWDLATGKVLPYAFQLEGQAAKASFSLPPAGSLLLFLSDKPRPSAPAATVATTDLSPSDALEIRRIQPNVLTLDYVDVTAGTETRTNVYFYQAQQFVFQQNGLERNPWDNAVQFKDEIIRKKFPATSGFTASYRFTIEDQVPSDLAIVIERPDLYVITCNDQAVNAKAGDWWLDKSFGRILLSGCANLGENVVTIKASPFTVWHELEPAYLLGSFSVQPKAKGFALGQDTLLNLGPWNAQGHPFYATGVAYRQTFEVAARAGRYVVALPNWYGSVARVSVNGKPAGNIACAPWECDVTAHLKTGRNTIEVTVIGTLKNTLGPHHNNPALGAAWPSAFQKGPPALPPASEYSTVGYGLFAPFALRQMK